MFQTEKDVSQLNPKELNQLCKKHRISTKDSRPSKISKVCSVLGISSEDTSDFSKVLQSIKAENTGWTKNIRDIPQITLSTVTDYLIRAHDTQVHTESGNIEVWNAETLKRYRALRSYLHFDAGHVHSMEYLPMSGSHFCAVRALCNPSYDSAGTMHHPIVVLRKDRDDPVGAHCSCKAGRGEACTHAAAILWALEDFTSRGYHSLPDNPSSTEILSKWVAPRNAKVEPKPLKEVQFKQVQPSDDEPSRKRKALYDFNPVAPSKRHVNVDNLHRLIHNLNTHHPRAPFLTIADPNKFGVPSVLVANDPTKELLKDPPMTLAFDATELVPGAEYIIETTTKDPPSLLESTSNWITNNLQGTSKPDPQQIDGYVSSLSISDEDQTCIDKLTTGQADNSKWFLYRRGMITGTTIRRVFTKMVSITNGKSNESDSLVKTIVGDSKFRGNRATRYGTQNEDYAVREYERMTASKHRNFRVLKSGLLVYKKHAFIGGSPDGICCCDCHSNWILEVKCPLTLKDKSVEQFTHSFLNQNSTVKKNHPYYAQLQTNMAISQLHQSDFVLWSNKGCKIITIKFDPEHWNDLLSQAVPFFRQYVAPVLLDRCDLREQFVGCSAARETVKDKICGSCNEKLVEDVTNDDEASVQCDCQECDCRQWFHWKCSNYDPNYFEEDEEDSDWFCPKCVRNCDIVM